MIPESGIMLTVIGYLLDLSTDEFLDEVERIIGHRYDPDNVFWNMSGQDIDEPVKIGLLNQGENYEKI